MKPLLPLVLFGAVVATAACVTSSRRATDPIELTERSDGSAVAAAPGQTIVLRLPANPTTGYQWRVDREPDDDVVRVASSQYTADGPGGRPGAGGTQVWTLAAVAEGDTKIELSYVGPGRDEAVAHRFSVTFSVQ